MSRYDYDERRRRALTGLGPEYRNARDDSDRFASRPPRAHTLSLDEAVDRGRRSSRSPYASRYDYERKGGVAAASVSTSGGPVYGVTGGGGAPGTPYPSLQRHRHQSYALPQSQHYRLDAAVPFRHERHRDADEWRSSVGVGAGAGAGHSAAKFVVPQDMSASFEDYERPMDPRAFREECRKAYVEAAAARQRNAEMSVWGRCSWATYDKFEPPKRRRQ